MASDPRTGETSDGDHPFREWIHARFTVCTVAGYPKAIARSLVAWQLIHASPLPHACPCMPSAPSAPSDLSSIHTASTIHPAQHRIAQCSPNPTKRSAADRSTTRVNPPAGLFGSHPHLLARSPPRRARDRPASETAAEQTPPRLTVAHQRRNLRACSTLAGRAHARKRRPKPKAAVATPCRTQGLHPVSHNTAAATPMCDAGVATWRRPLAAASARRGTGTGGSCAVLGKRAWRPFLSRLGMHCASS
jgi:hypothetical protein